MAKHTKPIQANQIPAETAQSLYPEPFKAMMDGRIKRKLGNHFGLSNFGVNLTELQPHAMSALKHYHSKQDEFIYILSGSPTLIYGEQEFELTAGDCFGFKAGTGIGHQLINPSDGVVTYLEIGDRSDDHVIYPDEDLIAQSTDNGAWEFLHKDGTPYPKDDA